MLLPSLLVVFSHGWALVLVPLRPSSEHMLIVRAPGAQDQHERPSPFPSLQFSAPPPYPPPMDLSNLTPAEFKELVRGIVDDRLRELLGDPDLGLQLGEALRARLKESLANSERISGDELADKLGLRW